MRKPIFESEEEFKEFVYCGMPSYVFDKFDVMVTCARDNGFIRRNPVEEAEEMINFNLTHNREYVKIEEQKKILTAIEHLKNQIVELNKKVGEE